MGDTRLTILSTIREQGTASVADLAAALGISPISVRHHLVSLQAEGLVSVALQRQSVGRPKHIYQLTPAADRYFPVSKRYHHLADRLLDELKASLSPEQLSAILDRMAASIAARYGGIATSGTLPERLQKLVEILGEEGFRAMVHRVDETTLLAQVNCPYVSVGQRHPEICQIDQTIIRSILGQDVQRTACVLEGARVCTYSVQELK